jgi:hypothetical protein
LLPVIAAVVLACACGGPTTPSPPQTSTPPVDPTPPRANDAPVIDSLTSDSPRVEADGEVTVTASVQDAETPLDQLSYQWSAAPVDGAFTGTGRQVRWRAPRLQITPDVYSLTLLVTERYQLAGQPAEYKVSKTVQVHYNDSQTEIKRISMRFLTELFPNYLIPANVAVQDFSDSDVVRAELPLERTCHQGKIDEFNDVTKNRLNFQMLSGTYTDVSIMLDSAKTFANVSGLCTFVDIPKDVTNPNYGKRESISGVCTLTAVYENWKWALCTSHFGDSTGVVLLGNQRYRVPGYIPRS